jgi:hypothetical protein
MDLIDIQKISKWAHFGLCLVNIEEQRQTHAPIWG